MNCKKYSKWKHQAHGFFKISKISILEEKIKYVKLQKKKTKIETSAFYSGNAFFRLLLLITINFMEEFVLKTNYYVNLFFRVRQTGGMILKIICTHMAHENYFDFKTP